MKFEFAITNDVNTSAWNASNAKLEQDLHELTAVHISEEEVTTYLMDMIQALKPMQRMELHQAQQDKDGRGMLFLMYDTPSSMPADARVEYVYKPTYIAATILMTAMNRYNGIAENVTIQEVTHDVLDATMGRNFVGAGYDEYIGFIETLRIFGSGDTLDFLKKFPKINERFTRRFEEAFAFFETEISSGKIKDMWSGEDYSEKGKEVLKMYQNPNTPQSTHVWYACYGSNLSKERFMRYIQRCTDKTPPAEDRPFVFDHPIYFAKSASHWQNGGKAFLDDSSTGLAYGRIYKITREQYEEVKLQEGSDYTKKVSFGEIDGFPVYSFTDTQLDVPTRTPSKEYFSVILRGLKECYSGILSESEMVDYLICSIIPQKAFTTARAIKENAHYMTNTEISSTTGLELSDVLDATAWLIYHNVIQQDQRSIRAGHQVDAPEAFFFTVDNPCARGLLTAMIEALPTETQEEESEPFGGETEGNRRFVFASRIERSSCNRIEAIRLHGYKCQVCGFDFAEVYGDLGRNYIEVHHINPLAEQEGEQIVNPETDLVCLCANCHRMIHRNRHNVLSVAELKDIVKR